jgi:hypothetical protein
VVKIVNSGALLMFPITSLKVVRPALDRTVHEPFAFTYHLQRTFFFVPFAFVISNLVVLSTQVEVGDPTGAAVGVDAVHCLQDSGQFVFPRAYLLHLNHVFFLANLGVQKKER